MDEVSLGGNMNGKFYLLNGKEVEEKDIKNLPLKEIRVEKNHAMIDEATPCGDGYIDAWVDETIFIYDSPLGEVRIIKSEFDYVKWGC